MKSEGKQKVAQLWSKYQAPRDSSTAMATLNTQDEGMETGGEKEEDDIISANEEL